jgi:hypothetical protein
MRKPRTALAGVILLCLIACSPRDFLTRRLAADLIAASEAFKSPQQFWLRTGIVSNKDYLSPDYLVLQRHGWITGANVPCTPNLVPPPCWDVALTPLGVETVRELVANETTGRQYFAVPVARRQLLGITGIAKNGNVADVNFQWRWAPLNEVGAALYAGDVQYNSAVVFTHYDDGWRLTESNLPKSAPNLDDALKNATPAQ